MRVVLDVSAVPAKIAGAGRYIAEVASRLPDYTLATTLVTRRDDAPRWRERSPRASISPIVPNSRATRLAFEATLLARTTPARQCDVWHAPHYTMPRGLRAPVVVTIHDLTLFTHPEWHERRKVVFFQRAIRYSLAHAAVVICVSDATRRELVATLAPSVPVVVAPLGVDTARFHDDAASDDRLLAPFGDELTRPFILFVGTLEPRKGLDVLLEAFEITAARDSEIELWVAGQSGWGDGEIARRWRTHRYAGRVRPLGFVDDDALPALMRRARAVVYPSRGEGFGLPVLEAMACGAIVITTRGTVMAEVAGDGALLVGVGEAEELAETIAVALDRDFEAAPLRHRATQRAGEFTWARTLDAHLDAYERAMSRS